MGASSRSAEYTDLAGRAAGCGIETGSDDITRVRRSTGSGKALEG